MNRLVYSLFFYLISPLIWSYFLYRAIRAPEYREGFWQRLGQLPKAIKGGGILVHCASVGEARAAAPLIERLVAEYPKLTITLSTTTPTGKQSALSLFAQAITSGRVELVYLPVDWHGSVRRFLRRLKPQLIILMETELWFNLLAQSHSQRIPVLLANARLSDKSLAKYLKFPRMAGELFGYISQIAAQYDSDKNNFELLGVPKERIARVGSIKFDLQIAPQVHQSQQELRRQWTEGRPVWIAASIHPAEFDQILKAHKEVLKHHPDLLLIGVPRHPEKFVEFKQACDKHQLNWICRSDNVNPAPATQVIVGDTLGEMLLFCGAADLAYVGGSLIERGGHNPLEPLVCGLPVVMGPHFYNFTDICQLLIAEQLMDVVTDEAQLALTIGRLISAPQERHQRSQRALNFMAENRGCVDRLVELSQGLLTR